MLFITLFTFICIKIFNNYSITKIFINSGNDERNIIIKNDTNIIKIKILMDKYKLLQKLQNNDIPNQVKLRKIYESHFFDEYNTYVIKPPNLTKGLKW
jgi:hypothetical protein